MGLGAKIESKGTDVALIGKGVDISGEVVFKEKIEVHGKILGKVTSESGTLILGETGNVEAQVEVGVCIIEGALQGDITARSKIEVRKTGRITGDMNTPVLIVEEGALVNGAVRMVQPGERRLQLGERKPNETLLEGKRRIGA